MKTLLLVAVLFAVASLVGGRVRRGESWGTPPAWSMFA